MARTQSFLVGVGINPEKFDSDSMRELKWPIMQVIVGILRFTGHTVESSVLESHTEDVMI